MLSAARPAFRVATASLRRNRRTLSSINRPLNNSYVPLLTVSACAITSGSMYYYFMSRVQNESELPEEVTETSTEKPVEVIEILTEQPAEIIEVATNEVEEIVVIAKDAVQEAIVEAVQEVVETIPAEPVSSTESLEEEAAQQGAFNEETGEINWDCPCLGGMANGPCGEEFKEAFSCFVYSKEEPKGIECIDKFKGMQDCFRRYPEVYSEELRDDEALEQEVLQTERAVDQAVMNNDIIESVEEAIEEAKEIKNDVKKTAIDLYSTAQKKIDDFHKK